MRVVSVLPSATEIVAELGHERDLVGRSAECDYPPTIRDRAIVMRPKVNDFSQSSDRIDARVREVRSRNESLYSLDVELLRALRPDVLLTQDLCSVCSVTEAEVAAACAVAGVTPNVVSLTPRTLQEVWESVDTVARALQDRAAGTRVRRSLELRTATGAVPARRSRVVVVEWLDPPILAGLWAPDIIERAGGVPVGPKAAGPGERTTWSEIESLAADLVILSPCSFSVDRTRHEILQGNLAHPLRALEPPLGIFLADEAYFSRPGPRLADGVELVRALLAGARPPGPMPVRRWTPSEVPAR
ncbi:MAG: ABC transporter substrate-binding protein [Thermoplasmata archaeon]